MLSPMNSSDHTNDRELMTEFRMRWNLCS